MDLMLRVAELFDHLSRAIGFARLTPTRRARAAEEGWPVAFLRRIDWDLSGGPLAARLVDRIGMTAACGCRLWNTAVVLVDIDCTEHEEFDLEL